DLDQIWNLMRDHDIGTFDIGTLFETGADGRTVKHWARIEKVLGLLGVADEEFADLEDKDVDCYLKQVDCIDDNEDEETREVEECEEREEEMEMDVLMDLIFDTVDGKIDELVGGLRDQMDTELEVWYGDFDMPNKLDDLIHDLNNMKEDQMDVDPPTVAEEGDHGKEPNPIHQVYRTNPAHYFLREGVGDVSAEGRQREPLTQSFVTTKSKDILKQNKAFRVGWMEELPLSERVREAYMKGVPVGKPLRAVKYCHKCGNIWEHDNFPELRGSFENHVVPITFKFHSNWLRNHLLYGSTEYKQTRNKHRRHKSYAKKSLKAVEKELKLAQLVELLSGYKRLVHEIKVVELLACYENLVTPLYLLLVVCGFIIGGLLDLVKFVWCSWLRVPLKPLSVDSNHLSVIVPNGSMFMILVSNDST
ncbi:hypothetical protein HDU99_000078, partial [Rhizoclosmatium hyalinum]